MASFFGFVGGNADTSAPGQGVLTSTLRSGSGRGSSPPGNGPEYSLRILDSESRTHIFAGGFTSERGVSTRQSKVHLLPNMSLTTPCLKASYLASLAASASW